MAFPEGLETIGPFAFCQSGLESVELPASLRTVAQGAFAMCEHLATASFSDGLEVLGTEEQSESANPWPGVFAGSAVRSVRLPATLRLIEEGAFKNCGNLESIELPQGLQGIAPKGFFGADLVSVRFPPSLMIIDPAAFYGSRLQAFSFPPESELQMVAENAFGGTFLEARDWKHRFPRGACIAPYTFACNRMLTYELEFDHLTPAALRNLMNKSPRQ